MKFLQQGRVAVVTGASHGQGIAEVFAQAGATMVVAARNEDRGARVVAGIEGQGGRAHFVHCDIGTVEGIEGLVAAVHEQSGGIDVLVHNAGVFPMVAIDALSEAQLEETLAVNLKAAFRLAKAVVPAMRRRGRGRRTTRRARPD